MFAYSFKIYVPFFDKSHILDMMGIYFWKIGILYLGGKLEKNMEKIRDSRFVDRSISRFFCVFGLRFASNLYILEAFKHLPPFEPKWRNMTSLKHHFLKNDGFFWNFGRRRQIDAV